MNKNTFCQTIGLELTPAIEMCITEAINSIDLKDTLSIGRYGAPEQSRNDIGHDHNEAVGSISSAITGLVQSLEKANPKQALKRKKTGFLARFTGQDAVQKVEYFKATESIDDQLSTVPVRIKRLESIVRELDKDYEALRDVQTQLKVAIVAGQLFLEANPSTGVEEANGYGLKSSRDRFNKRLQDLTVLLTSNGTTLHQIQLLQANSINLIDRLHEITSVLIPSWRSHRMSLYVNDQDYNAIAEATQSHDALVESLRAL